MKGQTKGGEKMGITGATWFLLLVPMPILIVLSVISLFTEGRGK